MELISLQFVIQVLLLFVACFAIQSPKDLERSPFVAPKIDAKNYYVEFIRSSSGDNSASKGTTRLEENVIVLDRFEPVELFLTPSSEGRAKANQIKQESNSVDVILDENVIPIIGKTQTGNAKYRIKREEIKTKYGGGPIGFGGGHSHSQAQAQAVSASINFGPIGASFSSANSAANSHGGGGFGPFGGGGSGSHAAANANAGSFGGGPFGGGGGSFSGAQAAAQSNSLGGGFGGPGFGGPGFGGPGFGGPGFGGPGFGGPGYGNYGPGNYGNSFSSAQASAQSSGSGFGGHYPHHGGYYPGPYGHGYNGYGNYNNGYPHGGNGYYNPGGGYYPRPHYHNHHPHHGGGGLYDGGYYPGGPGAFHGYGRMGLRSGDDNSIDNKNNKKLTPPIKF